MRTCTTCKEAKPLDQFARSTRAKDGLHTLCKACKAAQSRAWYHATPERQKARNKRRYAEHGPAMRAAASRWFAENKARITEVRYRWRLRTAYGLTPEAYVEMVEAQRGLCAACGNPPHDNRGLRIDHSHETGEVRGLLCHHCNVGLGHFDDSPERLRAVADYLERAAQSKTA